MTTQTITKSLTIPAREVRPGDVLFGMTVTTSKVSSTADELWFIGTESKNLWLAPRECFTVERPVPSDPIGTVRAQMVDDFDVCVFWKQAPNVWTENGTTITRDDAQVADFPILWKPGMPIPSKEA